MMMDIDALSFAAISLGAAGMFLIEGAIALVKRIRVRRRDAKVED